MSTAHSHAPPADLKLGAGHWLSPGWAVLGIGVTLVEAICRLGWRACRTLATGLGWQHWLTFGLLSLLLVYVEGYRGFQRRFVPAVIERALALRDVPNRAWHWLAPLYATGLLGASPKVIARSWLGVALIVAAVLLVRSLPEPWRGIVDGAVAMALSWGLVALGLTFPTVLRAGRPLTSSPRRDP